MNGVATKAADYAIALGAARKTIAHEMLKAREDYIRNNPPGPDAPHCEDK